MNFLRLSISFISLILLSFILCSCNKLLLPSSAKYYTPNEDISQIPPRMIPYNGHCQIQNSTLARTDDDISRGRMFFMVFGQNVGSNYLTFGYQKLQGKNISLAAVVRYNIKVDNEFVNMVKGKIEFKDKTMSHNKGTNKYRIVMRDRKKCQEQEGSDRICNLGNKALDDNFFISDIYDSTIDLTIEVKSELTYTKWLIRDVLPISIGQLNNYLPSGVDKITTVLGTNLQKKLESNIIDPSSEYLCVDGWVL